MIAQQIKKCSSDVIGIQEARKDPYYVKTSLDSVVSRILDIFHKDRHTSRDMMKDLMDLLPEYPYHYEHESMYYKDGIVESIALISRFPIANVKTIKLTKSPGDANQRSCLKATINHPKRQLSIFNTHMTYDSKGQILQSNEILGFMDQENDGSPQILTGDMNIKQSYEIPGHLFEGKYKYRGKTGDLKDAFKAANGDIEFPTHPSWKPKDRLDRIYFRNLDAPPVCEVCGYADSKTVWPSDHCSVFADFIIALS